MKIISVHIITTLIISLFITSSALAAPLTEREELTLSLNQLTQIEASLHRAQQSGAQSGVGLTPLIQEEQDKIQPLIIDMVNRSQPVNDDTLAQASGGELHLTRGVIEALRDDPDAAVLIQRLSGELALSRVMEQALMARRTLLAGMREPNVSGEKEAQTALTQTTAQLDQELSQLKLELDMRQALADNAALTILERQTMRAKTKGQAVGVEDDTDKRVDDLSKPTDGDTQ